MQKIVLRTATDLLPAPVRAVPGAVRWKKSWHNVNVQKIVLRTATDLLPAPVPAVPGANNWRWKKRSQKLDVNVIQIAKRLLNATTALLPAPVTIVPHFKDGSVC